MERQTCERFHDVEYNIRARAETASLYVEVIRKSDHFRWANLFSRRYIEEMTQKTGNFKAFDVFCKMVFRGLERPGDSVFIDLLTYSDLEALKQQTTSRTSNLSSTTRTKNKRYLIITYVAEYDRVHYPLALKFVNDTGTSTVCSSIASESMDQSPRTLGDENLPPPSVRSTIAGTLRSSQSASTLRPLTPSTLPLQNGHQHFENIPISPRTYRRLLTENEQLKRQVFSLKEENAQDRIHSLNEEIQALRTELSRRDAEVRRLRNMNSEFHSKKILQKVDELEGEVERLGTELIEERTKYRHAEKEFRVKENEMERTIERLEANEDKFRAKARRLQEELEHTERQLDVARRKASRSRLFSTQSTGNLPKKSNDLRRSRSRTSKTSNSRQNHKKPPLPKRRRSDSSKSRPKESRTRSLSTSRKKSRGRSPARFDPTAWVKERQRKMSKSKSRERPVWGANSARSASPTLHSRSVSPLPRSKPRRRSRGKRERYSRNSFGALVRQKSRSQSPQPMYRSQSSTLKTKTKKRDEEEKMESIETSIPCVTPDEEVSDAETSFNPTKEIESIDARLNALQKFLRAAKAKSDK